MQATVPRDSCAFHSQMPFWGAGHLPGHTKLGFSLRGHTRIQKVMGCPDFGERTSSLTSGGQGPFWVSSLTPEFCLDTEGGGPWEVLGSTHCGAGAHCGGQCPLQGPSGDNACQAVCTLGGLSPIWRGCLWPDRGLGDQSWNGGDPWGQHLCPAWDSGQSAQGDGAGGGLGVRVGVERGVGGGRESCGSAGLQRWRPTHAGEAAEGTESALPSVQAEGLAGRQHRLEEPAAGWSPQSPRTRGP